MLSHARFLVILRTKNNTSERTSGQALFVVTVKVLPTAGRDNEPHDPGLRNCPRHLHFADKHPRLSKSPSRDIGTLFTALQRIIAEL